MHCDMYGYRARNEIGQNGQKYRLESSASWL